MLPDTSPALNEYTQCRARYHFTFWPLGITRLAKTGMPCTAVRCDSENIGSHGGKPQE
jgi:hypothetical protein